jgi:hypothetical protein
VKMMTRKNCKQNQEQQEVNLTIDEPWYFTHI